MQKPVLVMLSLLFLGSIAMAQTMLDTKWHCPKNSNKTTTFDVGDVPDHSYVIAQGTCNATSSESGFKEKTGAYTEFAETWKTSLNVHGRFNVTMDNGDKVFYTYQRAASTETGKPMSQTWNIQNGTGKYKGAEGTGTCFGKSNVDESSDWECMGTVSTGK